MNASNVTSTTPSNQNVGPITFDKTFSYYVSSNNEITDDETIRKFKRYLADPQGYIKSINKFLDGQLGNGFTLNVETYKVDQDIPKFAQPVNLIATNYSITAMVTVQ